MSFRFHLLSVVSWADMREMRLGAASTTQDCIPTWTFRPSPRRKERIDGDLPTATVELAEDILRGSECWEFARMRHILMWLYRLWE